MKPFGDKHAVEGPRPVKVAVPIKAAKPVKVDGRSKLIGNLGTYAHPPKGKKK